MCGRQRHDQTQPKAQQMETASSPELHCSATVAGGVVGGTVGLGLICLLVLIFYRHQRKGYSSEDATTSDPKEVCTIYHSTRMTNGLLQIVWCVAYASHACLASARMPSQCHCWDRLYPHQVSIHASAPRLRWFQGFASPSTQQERAKLATLLTEALRFCSRHCVVTIPHLRAHLQELHGQVILVKVVSRARAASWHT